MEIKPPPAFISAYSVMELMVLNHPQTGRPYLAHKDGRLGRSGERYVNTIDIETQYMMQGLFIVGWQETHYEGYYDANAALRFKEYTVTHTHQENKQRILQLKEVWDEYHKNPKQAFTVPDMVSLEHELTKLGWQFYYAADVGPVYPTDWDTEINWRVAPLISDDPQVLFSDYHGADPNHSTLGDGVENRGRLTVTEVSKPEPEPVNRLESKIDLLTDAVSQLIGVLTNANSHHARNDELCVSDPPPSDDLLLRRKPARPKSSTKRAKLGVSTNTSKR